MKNVMYSVLIVSSLGAGVAWGAAEEFEKKSIEKLEVHLQEAQYDISEMLKWDLSDPENLQRAADSIVLNIHDLKEDLAAITP